MGTITKKQLSKEEIKELLKQKREWIKNNSDYYGNEAPSKCLSYIQYKRFLEKT